MDREYLLFAFTHKTSSKPQVLSQGFGGREKVDRQTYAVVVVFDGGPFLTSACYPSL